jgi:membrane peptidoglycan carboxypeptidase
MPDSTQIIRLRHRHSEKKERNPFRKIGFLVSGCLSLGLVFSIIVIAFLFSSLTENLPSIEELPILLEPPNGMLLQPTRIYDRTGEHLLASLENPAAGNRQYLELNPLFRDASSQANNPNTLPNSLILATVATTDPDFWKHPGYTLEGLLNDAHLTLAQRLVSDLLLWDKPPGLKRALQERILAAQATRIYGRQKILEWYLNTTKYGYLVYGADTAAHAYFGKSATELDLAESAVLAAASETPSITPLTAPELSRARGREVLNKLLVNGLISPEEFLAADTDKLPFQQVTSDHKDLTPAFTTLILDQLGAVLGLERIERGGFRIITTIDYELQIQSVCTFTSQLRRMGGDFSEIKTSDGTDCIAERLLPTLPASLAVIPDKIFASAVIIDPRNGQLLALADVSEHRNSKTGSLEVSYSNTASLDNHPAGSILTPFIYLAGFTRGYSPASLVWDIPQPNAGERKAESDKKYHGPIRLRIALTNDYLNPAEQVLTQVGIENVLRIANQMGLHITQTGSVSKNPTNTSPEGVLSGSQINLVDLVQAFGVLANQGSLVGQPGTLSPNGVNSSKLDPITVLRVEDYDGKIWNGNPYLEMDQENVVRPVINPQLAYLLTNVLRDESARWASLGHPNALEIGKPAAAKIGSSFEGDDIWTIGYTPQLVVGIWVGYPPQNQPYLLPSNISAGVWHSLMQYSTRNMPTEGWNAPPGIVTLNVCDPSGLLPSDDCPSVVSEVFLEENAPTQTDTLYKRLQINRETGRLATMFTPPEYIESRVYLLVPPEAIDWARRSGFPIPPETYDIIQASTSGENPQVMITSPQMLSYVKDKVKITGTAAGEGFVSYRLRVGKGLYPEDWLEIDAENNTPVHSGSLGSWDTTGLNGLYSIQLMVVRQDQRIETSIVQVTIDNNSPEIELVYPSQGQTITMTQNGIITLQIKAVDDLGIKQVVAVMDGKVISTLTQPPYAIPWQSVPGNHIFVVKAIDLAGNTTEESIQFIVQ